MPRDTKTKRWADQLSYDQENVTVSDITDIDLPASSLNTVHPQIFTMGTDRTFGHDGDTSYTELFVVPVWCTGTSGSLGFRVQLKNDDAGETTSLKIEIDADGNGVEATRTSDSWGWVTNSSDYDVSGYTGWKEISVQLKTSNAGKAAEMRGLSIVWK